MNACRKKQALVIPLMPQYAKRVNIDPAMFGLLGAAYGTAQLIGSPFMGVLSDRVGRVFVLLVSCAGTAVSYVLIDSGIYSFFFFFFCGGKSFTSSCFFPPLFKFPPPSPSFDGGVAIRQSIGRRLCETNHYRSSGVFFSFCLLLFCLFGCCSTNH